MSALRINCSARPLPTSRGRRCVPPYPGMMPIVTSGWPNLAVSTASRIVQAIASSQPPPRAKPLTAAMTGLPRFSMTLVRRWPCRVLSSASAGVSLAISAMSAPAANALSPAPVRMTPRTAASSRASLNASFSSAMVALLRALSTFGRLIVTYAIVPFFSYRTFSRGGAAVAVLMGVLPCW